MCNRQTDRLTGRLANLRAVSLSNTVDPGAAVRRVDGITWVGLDTHKATIQVAMLLKGRDGPVDWQVANEPAAVKRLAHKVQRAAPGEVRSCYEAGVCGYTVQRQLAAAGMPCTVIAPALIPRKAGERVKTDRRDARKLAELLSACLLTAVRPPTPSEEAARDLCRGREDVREDLLRARHRLGKFLLRRGLVWHTTKAWTQAHRQWLRSLRFAETADQAVLTDYCLAVEQLEARLETVDAALVALAQTEPAGRSVRSSPTELASESGVVQLGFSGTGLTATARGSDVIQAMGNTQRTVVNDVLVIDLPRHDVRSNVA